MTTLEPPPKASIWAAGCVVSHTTSGGKYRYLLVHRPAYDDWSLPKGKLDKGETFLEAAIREVEEETGVRGRDPRFVGSVGYITKAGNPKVVRWWLAEGDKGSFSANSEVDRIAWKRPGKAQRVLSYRNDREVLRRAHQLRRDPTSGVIYLVRHGAAGPRREGAGDKERPLTKVGRRQAKAIRNLLLAHPITRIGSSGHTRCLDTVAPLSDRLGVPTEIETSLVEGAHPHRLVGLITEMEGQTAVLCTHGDVIADLVGHLFAERVPMDGPREWEKGSIWALTTSRGRVVSGRYIAPLA